MADVREVKVPDIGDFNDVPVIEILVKPGDRVSAEDPLITLESDKATLDVPAPFDGVVREIRVEVGATVSEGTALLTLETSESGEQAAAPEPPAAQEAEPAAEPAAGSTPAAGAHEHGKSATAPEAAEPAEPSARRDEAPPAEARAGEAPAAETPTERPRPGTDPEAAPPERRQSPTAEMETPPGSRATHATPSVRRFARELGVEIERVTGTGRKGRVTQDDVTRFVKQTMEAPPPAAAPVAPARDERPAATARGIEPVPAVDFAKFGPVETRPLSRIKRISGPFLQRAWLNIPHVTHHDEADVTELEAFRKSLKDEAERRGVRVTMLFFLMKALVGTLREFPTFNASLTPDGQSLVLKNYFHVGIAVDTPNGLVVPVVRDVDQKGVFDLAAELGEISERAREGKLRPDEMQGGSMSISSLGGIGGIGFTPIVNAPEVAILGVSRARMAPVWDGGAFVPRLMLPLDLSYDHRVVDGAEAARFVVHYAGLLGDIRRLLL